MRVTGLLLIGMAALTLVPTVQAVEPDAALVSADRDVLLDRIGRLEAQVETLQTQQNASMDEAREMQVRALVEDVVQDSEFRESMFPDAVQVGYDSGFFVCNPDDTFELKIGGVSQFRYMYTSTQTDNRSVAPGVARDNRSGFENAATHLWFTGHLFGKDLTFRVQGVWGNNGAPFNLFYSFLNYRFAPEFNVLVGLFKNPFGHQELQGAPLQMFAERGMVNEVFNLDRSYGVQLWGDVLDKQLQYKFAVTNGFATAYSPIDDSDAAVTAARALDNNPALTARLVWRAIGEMGAGDSDLQYHEDLALNFGLSLAYNDNNGDNATSAFSGAALVKRAFAANRGAFTTGSLVGTDTWQVGADWQLKYRGLAVTWEYFLRVIDISSPTQAAALVAALNGDDATSHQQGMELQVGYFIVPKEFEVVGRVGAVWDVGPGSECAVERALGVNYYFNGHNNKMTFDVSQVDELPVVSANPNYINLNDDVTMFRLQWQVMF